MTATQASNRYGLSTFRKLETNISHALDVVASAKMEAECMTQIQQEALLSAYGLEVSVAGASAGIADTDTDADEEWTDLSDNDEDNGLAQVSVHNDSEGAARSNWDMSADEA